MNELVVLIKILIFMAMFFFIISMLKKKNVFKYINNKRKSNKHIEKLLLKLDKIIDGSGITAIKGFENTTPIMIIIFCSVIWIISYILFRRVLKYGALILIASIIISSIPIYILLILKDINEEKIEKNLITYVIQLKNQAQISNDVINCFKQTIMFAPKTIKNNIEKFLFEASMGNSVDSCFSNLKERISSERFRQLIINIENCYYYGGNIYELLSKTQYILVKLNDERNKRNEQTMSARIVLLVLIAMSVFVYFKFVNNNQENLNIMLNNMFGRCILIFNFISIWIMLYLIIYVKKIDD